MSRHGRPREVESRLVYSTAGEKPSGPVENQPPVEGRLQAIRLRLERRASNRLVTVVTGLPGSREALSALARELKSACGTGGSAKDGALELQGDQRERVEAWLQARGLRCKRAGG